MRTILLSGAIAMMTAGCGVKTTYVPTNPSPRPMAARPASQVAVFTTKLPQRPYTEVGILEAQAENQFIEMPELIRTLRDKAGEIGCDAIIMTTASNEVVGGKHGVATHKGHRATCVVFSTPAPAAPATTGAHQAEPTGRPPSPAMVTVALSEVPDPEGSFPASTRVTLAVAAPNGRTDVHEIGTFGPGCPMRSAGPKPLIVPGDGVVWELHCFYAGSGVSLRLRTGAVLDATKLFLERAPAGEEETELRYQPLWSGTVPSSATIQVTAPPETGRE